MKLVSFALALALVLLVGCTDQIYLSDDSNTQIDINGAIDFNGLTDTPANYAGSSLECVRVNVGETGLEFVVCSTGGGGGGSYTGVLPIDVNSDTNVISLDVNAASDWIGLFDGFDSNEFILWVDGNTVFYSQIDINNLIGTNITKLCSTCSPTFYRTDLTSLNVDGGNTVIQNGTINISAGFLSSLIPNNDNQRDLGSLAKRWKRLWVYDVNAETDVNAGERFCLAGDCVSDWAGYDNNNLVENQIPNLTGSWSNTVSCSRISGGTDSDFCADANFLAPGGTSTYIDDFGWTFNVESPAKNNDIYVFGGKEIITTSSAIASDTNTDVGIGLSKIAIETVSGADATGSIFVCGTKVNRDTGTQTAGACETLNGFNSVGDINMTRNWYMNWSANPSTANTVSIGTTNMTANIKVTQYAFHQNEQQDFNITRLGINFTIDGVNPDFNANLIKLSKDGLETNLINIDLDNFSAVPLTDNIYRADRICEGCFIDASFEGIFLVFQQNKTRNIQFILSGNVKRDLNVVIGTDINANRIVVGDGTFEGLTNGDVNLGSVGDLYIDDINASNFCFEDGSGCFNSFFFDSNYNTSSTDHNAQFDLRYNNTVDSNNTARLLSSAIALPPWVLENIFTQGKFNKDLNQWVGDLNAQDSNGYFRHLVIGSDFDVSGAVNNFAIKTGTGLVWFGEDANIQRDLNVGGVSHFDGNLTVEGLNGRVVIGDDNSIRQGNGGVDWCQRIEADGNYSIATC